MKKNYHLNSIRLFRKALPLIFFLLFSNFSAQTGASNDFDGDGINNYDDIDDDNDGILDYIECQTVATLKRYNETGSAIWNGTTTITANRSSNTHITPETSSGTASINRIITGSSPSTYTNNFNISAPRETYWQINANSEEDQQGFVTFNFSSPIPISDLIIVLQDVDYRKNSGAPTITISISGGTATTQNLIPYKVGSLDLPDSNNMTNGGYNATTGIISYNVPLLGSDTNDNRAYALVGNSSATVTSVKVSYNLDEKAQVLVGRIDTSACDPDNDGILNHFDLDSDGDGCPDAVEAGVVDFVGAVGMQSGSIRNGSNGSVTSTKTVVESVVSGSYGTNGFASSAENNDTFSAVYKNANDYTYSQAVDSSTSVCCSNFTAGTLSGNQNICSGSTTAFSSTQTGGTWSSANTAIATINSSTGVVTGVATGTATITYSYDKYSGPCPKTATRTVNVTAAPNAGTISGNQNVCIGNTTTFSSTHTGGTWSSANTAIATVNSTTGVVTGIAAGTATITYTVAGTGGCANATATRTVTITAAPSAGTISGSQNICVGNTTTFSSTHTGGTWSSANTAIATVNSTTGVVTGVAAGTATITYTVAGTGGCANATATRTVTVLLSCIDSDGDGIPDDMDIDDDNDGILDAIEESCQIISVPKTNIIVTKPSTINYTFDGAQTLANLVDGTDTNDYIIWNPTGTLNNSEWFRVELATPKVLTQWEVGQYSSQTLFSTTSTYKIQGSADGNTWVDLTGTLTYANNGSGQSTQNNSNIAQFPQNNNAYKFYRYYGIAGTAGNGWATEFYFKEKICRSDFDVDGVPNWLDLDSDNDGCSDLVESGVNPATDVSTPASANNNNGTSYGIDPAKLAGSQLNVTATDTNNDGLNDSVDADLNSITNYTSTYSNAINAAIASCTLFCYKPAVLSGTVLSTPQGITSLHRAGVDADNWPMVRKGAWTALEAKTKGFVPNRLTIAQINLIPAGDLREGMMVYNISSDCLYINTDGTPTGWKCFNTQACP